MPSHVPEDYSERIEMIAGYPVAITSYRLGPTYFAKAAVALLGMGGRIAAADGATRQEVEDRIRAEARRAIDRK